MGNRSEIALGAALVAAGGALDLPSLYVPGIALALLWAGSTLWAILAARGAQVEQESGPSTVVEAEPYPLRIRFRRGLVPPRGELAHPLLERPLRIPAWFRGAERRTNLTVRFPRRGRRRLGTATLFVRDPLRIAQREARSEEGGVVLVLPRVEPVLACAEGGEAREMAEGPSRAEGELVPDRGPIDFQIDGIRPYREGTPASRIHWPAVARSGELHERHLVASAESSPLVVLDASRPAHEESLDRAVRAAASICLHLAGAGGCALLLPGESRPIRIDPGLRAWPDAHARLALVESDEGSPAIGRARHSGAVFWVTARGAGGVPQIPARAAYLVSPAPVPGLRVIFTVAGCAGQLRAVHGRPAGAAAGRAA